ncbi:hypothetical protein KEM52_003364 [Ascosphaera acerosa]|nr:hypothetical protein KEM52_003364 [Ascosphaera acerosa]
MGGRWSAHDADANAAVRYLNGFGNRHDHAATFQDGAGPRGGGALPCVARLNAVYAGNVHLRRERLTAMAMHEAVLGPDSPFGTRFGTLDSDPQVRLTVNGSGAADIQSSPSPSMRLASSPDASQRLAERSGRPGRPGRPGAGRPRTPHAWARATPADCDPLPILPFPDGEGASADEASRPRPASPAESAVCLQDDETGSASGNSSDAASLAHAQGSAAAPSSGRHLGPSHDRRAKGATTVMSRSTGQTAATRLVGGAAEIRWTSPGASVGAVTGDGGGDPSAEEGGSRGAALVSESRTPSPPSPSPSPPLRLRPRAAESERDRPPNPNSDPDLGNPVAIGSASSPPAPAPGGCACTRPMLGPAASGPQRGRARAHTILAIPSQLARSASVVAQSPLEPPAGEDQSARLAGTARVAGRVGQRVGRGRKKSVRWSLP